MSYHIYSTEAVILKKRDFGEADRVYSFFTKDFGRLEIKAQGVRYLKSKLRYHLSGDSVLKVSFVSTSNEYFRLVGVEEQRKIKNNRFFEITDLLECLVQGREKDEKIWDILKEAVLVSNENNGFALRFLAILGYAGLSIKDALEQSML